MFYNKIKNKCLRVSIYIFSSLLLFLIISWFLTATIGIKAVKKKHEAFLKHHYTHCKKAYKKEPNKLGKIWTTPQMGVSPRRASFWRRKLFKEKRYPSFEEWEKFHTKRNTISYSTFYPFFIESKHSNWKKEYHFWFFGYTRKYKHDILAYID